MSLIYETVDFSTTGKTFIVGVSFFAIIFGFSLRKFESYITSRPPNLSKLDLTSSRWMRYSFDLNMSIGETMNLTIEHYRSIMKSTRSLFDVNPTLQVGSNTIVVTEGQRGNVARFTQYITVVRLRNVDGITQVEVLARPRFHAWGNCEPYIRQRIDNLGDFYAKQRGGTEVV